MKTKESFKQRLVGLQGNLLSFAYQLTTNREAAEDLLQDTTLKALDNEEKYVDNVNFKGWIFTIMRNIFINNYRQTVRKATVIDQTEDLYHLNISQDSGLDTPEGSFAVKEISAAVNAFSPEYRRIQIQRNCGKDESPARHREEPHILCAEEAPRTTQRLQCLN